MPQLSMLLFALAIIGALGGFFLQSTGYSIAFALLVLGLLRYFQDRWRKKGQQVVL